MSALDGSTVQQRASAVSAGVAAAVLRAGVLAGLYALYAWARDTHGAATAAALGTARRHAAQISSLQDALGLPHERGAQAHVLGAEAFVRLCGAYYAPRTSP